MGAELTLHADLVRAAATLSVVAALSGCASLVSFPNPRHTASAQAADLVGDVSWIPSRYVRLANAAGTHFHVDPALILAVCQQESEFKPRAVSTDGAEGLMQLMPDTAARMGVVLPFNPRQAIWGGTRYLSLLMARFHGNLRLTLAAYNQGAAAVADEANDLPPSAVRYVDGVLNKYRALRGAEGFHDAD